MNAPILIVGAGPTGLNLALRLKRHGTLFRIVDQASGPGTQSRALAVQARTLEFYQQLGFDQAAIEAGVRVDRLRMLEAGRQVGAARLGDFGAGLSPFPFVLGLPQDEHEALLVAQLASEGVSIEWGVRLEAVSETDDGVEATLVGPAGQERAQFSYVAGCDGAHSRVREATGVRFAGGTYERLYYVADVRPRGPVQPELVFGLDPAGFTLCLPARQGENLRLIGFVPDGRERDASFEDVRESVQRTLGVTVEAVHWFSTYRVHHRVADRFRAGRSFLLGDAAHVHSPVGGQGMNTGIGDAVNLGWKLAQVVAGRAPDSLLDTYEVERIAFARQLVATTDRAFRAIADTGAVGEAVRGFIMPRVFPVATELRPTRRAIFRLISQIRVAYPRSALSQGRAGRVCGGHRLPWLPDQDNFAPLAALAWQVHAFGGGSSGFTAELKDLGLRVHSFEMSTTAREAGFADGAAYLVRPDGYVAVAQRRPDASAIRAYAEQRGLRFD